MKGFCRVPSTRRCLAAASTVCAWVALLSIMSIIRGPIFISSVSLPVAIFASRRCAVSFACGCAANKYTCTVVLLRGRSRPVAGLVVCGLVCGYPVPPSRSGQYRGYGPACLTCRRRRVGPDRAPCWLVSLTDVCTPALHCKCQSDS